MYRYRIKNTRASSEKFGPCEVCNTRVSEVYYQVEEESYTASGATEWTQCGCKSLFGHLDCLERVRR